MAEVTAAHALDIVDDGLAEGVIHHGIELVAEEIAALYAVAFLVCGVLPNLADDELVFAHALHGFTEVIEELVGKLVRNIKAEAGGLDRQVVITVVKPKPVGAVDLGLNVYWGYKNIKMSSNETSVWASSETAAGDYYAWGERKSRSKTTFTQVNYYWNYESGTGYIYTVIDNNHTNDPCATLYPAGTWRLPTAEEVTELINNCDKTITAINGTIVCKFTSKTNPDVDITIPRIEASDGVGGNYWTSTFGESSPNTLLIGSSGSPTLSSKAGWVGCQIRPVCDK